MSNSVSPHLAKFGAGIFNLQSTEEELDIAARTVWAEARGEGEDGMRAVAAVLVNRAAAAASWIDAKDGRTKHPLFGEGDLASAAQAPWQFSCWNKNDPNLKKMQELPTSDTLYKKAMDAVLWVLQNDDPTGGATHYYSSSIKAPEWTEGATFSKKIGHHSFYKNVK